MKNTFKRSLAVLLAVLMLLCAVPFASFAAEKCTVCGKGTLTGETKKIEATCTEPGYIVLVCSDANCPGQKQVDKNAPKKGHTWDEKVDAKYLKEAAYCSGKATYYKSCKVCGASAKDETNAASMVFEDKNSQFDSNKHLKITYDGQVIESTCVDYGYIPSGTCDQCHAKIPGGRMEKKAHVVGTPANCVDKAICKECKQPFGEKDSKNHKEIVTDAAKAPTCKEKGLTEGKHCKACGTTIEAQTEVPLADHTPVQNTVQPTCEAPGVLNQMKCKVCGKELDPGTVLPATGHKWGDWITPAGYTCEAGGNIKRVCSVCKKEEAKTTKPGDHALVTDEAVPATCTKEGLAEGSHCGICKATILAQAVVPALGHEFTGEVVSNKNGTHSYKCVRCGEVGGTVDCTDKNRDCVCDLCKEAVPHTFTDYKPNGDATCEKDGTMTATCDICGKVKDTKPDVGSTEKAPHDYKFVKQDDATCLGNAHEIGTCTRCGATMTREIEGTALGHDVSDWKVPEGFDCTIGGYRFKDCKRCGVEIEHQELPAGDHKEVEDLAVKETCTTDGKTKGSHCAVCGYVFAAQAVIPAPGHKADANGFKTVTAATCDKEGEEKATCAVCKQEFTRAIPKTEHKYVTTVVPATCSAKGYSNHKCSVCGHTYKDNYTKSIGHSWKITVKPATLKKDGSRIYVCKVCKKKVTKTIDKIGSVKLAATNLPKTGKKLAPAVIVRNSAGKKLKEGTAYTVKYAGGRKNLGTYKVTVTFIGNYKGTKALTFNIVPAAPENVKAAVSGKNVTLTWSKVKGADSYLVYRSTSKDGKYKKIATVEAPTLTVKNLKKGNYFFKVKAVHDGDSAKLNGVASAPVKAKVK